MKEGEITESTVILASPIVGSAVKLDDGSCGLVCMSNPSAPLRPKVLVVRDEQGALAPQREVDLAEQGAPAIERSITFGELGLRPGQSKLF